MQTGIVLIPTYNEAENVRRLIPMLLELPGIQVVVVDDNSTDSTSLEVSNYLPTNRVHLINRCRKLGRRSAVNEGILWALNSNLPADVFFEMDADLSHSPYDIPRLLEGIKQAEIVVGSRYHENSQILEWPYRRYILSRISNRILGILFDVDIKDMTGGFRCYRREVAGVISSISLISKGYYSNSELVVALIDRGHSFAEVPITFLNRQYGISKFSFLEILDAGISLYYNIKARSTGFSH